LPEKFSLALATKLFSDSLPRADYIMISAVDHIDIVVSDLERSVKFYTELLGFREIRRDRLEGKWIESVVGL
jgi:catechol-2,3-dioxygenase